MTFGKSLRFLIFTKNHIHLVNLIFQLSGWLQGTGYRTLPKLSNATICGVAICLNAREDASERCGAKTTVWIKGGEKQTYIWQEAVVRYLQEADKKSIDDDKSMQRWIAQHLDNRYTHDIDKTVIESIIHALRR